jgi:hypothetical protein
VPQLQGLAHQPFAGLGGDPERGGELGDRELGHQRHPLAGDRDRPVAVLVDGGVLGPGGRVQLGPLGGRDQDVDLGPVGVGSALPGEREQTKTCLGSIDARAGPGFEEAAGGAGHGAIQAAPTDTPAPDRPLSTEMFEPISDQLFRGLAGPGAGPPPGHRPAPQPTSPPVAGPGRSHPPAGKAEGSRQARPAVVAHAACLTGSRQARPAVGRACCLPHRVSTGSTGGDPGGRAHHLVSTRLAGARRLDHRTASTEERPPNSQRRRTTTEQPAPRNDHRTRATERTTTRSGHPLG